VRSLAHRSTSRWRKRVSTSDTPFHLSPKPRRASARSTHSRTCTESSPLRVRTILPLAPTQSPSDSLEKFSKSSVTFSSANSWTCPEESRNVAKARRPWGRTSMTRPATATSSSVSSPGPSEA
jgi:hypothetical protein